MMASSDISGSSGARRVHSSTEDPTSKKKTRYDIDKSVSGPAVRDARRNAICQNDLFTIHRWRGCIYHNLYAPVYYRFQDPCSILLGKTQRHLSLKHMSPVDLQHLNLLHNQYIDKAAAIMSMSSDRVHITDSLYPYMADRFKWIDPNGNTTRIPFGIVFGWPTLKLHGTCLVNDVYQSVFWVVEVQQKLPDKENIAPIEEASNGGGGGDDAFAVHEWVPRADGEEWMRTNNPQEREYYYRQWAQE